MLRTPIEQVQSEPVNSASTAPPEPLQAAVNFEDFDAIEVRKISAALRTRLRFLEKGGVHEVPKPERSARPSKRANATAQPGNLGVSDVAGVSGEEPKSAMAEHVMPPKPLPKEIGRPAIAPASLRPSALVEAVYPELPSPAELRGSDGMSAVRRVLGDCRRCKLCHGRNNIVFGDGAPDAWLAFVGEGPGADEDRLGKPFVGAAGQLLDRMIDAMAVEARKRGLSEAAEHLSRSAVYICNVVKCRPPGNRTPEADEIATCTPFLRSQLYSLRPTLRVIVALGRTPTQYLLKTSTAISSLRGNFAEWEGISVMPTYHPAYLLRTPSAKRQVWEDLQKVLEVLSAPLPVK